MHGLGADLRLAARRLGATPLFTIFAILSLGVGVGVTTTVYSVVDSTLWRDVVVRQPEDVVFVMVPGRHGPRDRVVWERPRNDGA